MNIVVMNTFRRPWHTRMCMESMARAQRWYTWADQILIGMPVNWYEHPAVRSEAQNVIARNPDIPFRLIEEHCDSNPHVASKWLLDYAFSLGADITLYVEDDVIFSPDAFLMCEFTRQQYIKNGTVSISNEWKSGTLIGCCLYHETIPEQYVREGRSVDYQLVHMGNGLSTCGGTAFLRDPYLKYLAPEWNCKQVEPKGFDYSAHYLMYLHKLFMLWPDCSRSMNIGFTGGGLRQSEWERYFARSICATDAPGECVRSWKDFRLNDNPDERKVFIEPWMEAELRHRGMPFAP